MSSRPEHDVKLLTTTNQLRTQLMHFQLPSHLQQELLAYDPKLKALVREQSPNKPTKKAKYPLGNIPHLIPDNVVRSSYQQDAIDRINGELAPGRFQLFTKLVDVATPQARTAPVAILYHYEQCWYAAWLPPKGEEDKYVYGYAYAFKNTSAAAKVVPHQIWNSKDQCTEHQIGRGVQTFTYSAVITKEDIIAGNDSRHWRKAHVGHYYQKSRELANAITQFEQELMSTIPSWSDSRGIFDRLKCTNVIDALDLPEHWFRRIDKNKFELTVENLTTCCVDVDKTGLEQAWGPSIHAKPVAHIVTTPFIKKYIQAELDKSIAEFKDPDNQRRRSIQTGYNTASRLISSIYFVHSIWNDCPLDYYQNYIEELKTIRLDALRRNEQLIDWLRQHMPVASFFNMLRKHNEAEKANRNPFDNSEYRNFYELNDTFSMIMRILENGKTLESPKRWRMPDFHDYVQAEAWKIQNPNEKLHQDLFPEPIKVTMGDSDWTFLQPINTHQLSQWGQAVRNCVGSASQYAENIKKRKHFIVLCMIDGKPTFTIQLDVSMGVMNVKQIAGVANQRLDDEQREQYSQAFRKALQSREKQLASGS